MSYYIVSEDDGMVLESQESMSDDEIQEAADYFGCDVYAIRGQHSGYSAVCSAPVSPPAPTPPEVVQDKCKCGSDDIYIATAYCQVEFVGDQGSEHDLSYKVEDLELCAHYCGACGGLLDICVTEPRPAQKTTPLEVVQACADIAALPDGITSDEGQTRNYTEAEVRELLAQERERVIKTVYRILKSGGVDYGIDLRIFGKHLRAELGEVKHA